MFDWESSVIVRWERNFGRKNSNHVSDIKARPKLHFKTFLGISFDDFFLVFRCDEGFAKIKLPPYKTS